MDNYYSNQVNLPYYAGAARQRGSGLGALALTVGRYALPVLRNVLLPAAKRFGADLVTEGLPELGRAVDSGGGYKRALSRSVGRATKKSLKRTISQRGSGGTFSKSQNKSTSKSKNKYKKLKNSGDSQENLIPPSPKKAKTISSKKSSVQRSRYDVLSNLQ